MTPENLQVPTEIANNGRHLTSPGDQGAPDPPPAAPELVPPSGLINV